MLRRSSSKRKRFHLGVSLALAKRQHYRCAQCGLLFEPGDEMELDHFIPLVKGGSNHVRNMRLLHASCNRAKADSLGQHQQLKG